MPETQKPKPWWKSKTVWLGVLSSLAGLGTYAAVLPPKTAAIVLATSGAAGIVLRTVTKQPLDGTAAATDEAEAK